MKKITGRVYLIFLFFSLLLITIFLSPWEKFVGSGFLSTTPSSNNTQTFELDKTSTSNSLITPSPTLFEIDVNKTPITFVSTNNSFQLEKHSPDGKWVVRMDESLNILVFSTLTNTVTYSISLEDIPYTPGKCNRNIFFDSWFPDSNGFIVYDADSGCESRYDRLLVINLNHAKKELDYYVFEPEQERNLAFWPYLSYSPDGSQFAVATSGKEIDIVDLKGKIIQVYTPKKTESCRPIEVKWTRLGLLYVCLSDYDENQNAKSELRIINMTSTFQQETLLLSRNNSAIHVYSVDPKSPRIMLNYIYPNYDSIPWCGLVIFNVETKDFEDQICTDFAPYRDFSIVEAANQPYFGLYFFENGENFYIYDWSKNILINKNIQLADIIEW